MSIETKKDREGDLPDVTDLRSLLQDALKAPEGTEGMRLIYRNHWNESNWNMKLVCCDELVKRLLSLGLEFSEEKEEDIRITLDELMLNSFCSHDEMEDGHRMIEQSCFLRGNNLIVHIKDDGPGFDHKAEVAARQSDNRGLTRDIVTNMLNHEEVADVGGTGMFCLLNMTQGFQFNDKGNEVTVCFDLST